MRSILSVVFIVLAIVLVTFFTVFAFHAQTELQHDVKSFLETGVGSLPFSHEANAHMRDVLSLLTITKILGAIAVIFALFFASTASQLVFRISGYFVILLPLVLASIPWHTSFTVFHKIFFPQGNWQFPADSLLIQTYPQSFFIWFSVTWGFLLILSGTALLVYSRKVPA